jgi:hypothetical protein
MPVAIEEVRRELRGRIGESIEAYASVEAKQAFLLMSILKIDYRKACTIFFAVQNVRARALADQVASILRRRSSLRILRACKCR